MRATGARRLAAPGRMQLGAAALVGVVAAATGPAWGDEPVPPATTELVSVPWDPTVPPSCCRESSAGGVSADGRFVAFSSSDPTIVPDAAGGFSQQVYLRDRWAGTTVRVTSTAAGAPSTSGGYGPVVSANGRFVAYASASGDLGPDDGNGTWDIYRWDRLTGETVRVSQAWTADETDGSSGVAAISGDGRVVAFQSRATNLVPGDGNGRVDVFVWDATHGATERISEAIAGGDAEGDSGFPRVSADGSAVVFESTAPDLVADDDNGDSDAFLWDADPGVVTRVSRSPDGEVGGGVFGVEISADGSTVVYSSDVRDIVPGVDGIQVYAWERASGATSHVTPTREGTVGAASYWPRVSAGGRFVAFASFADDLVPGPGNGEPDVFVRDRALGTTEQASVTTSGSPTAVGAFEPLAISADGRSVTFTSGSSELVPEDTDGEWDAFLRSTPARPCDSGFADVDGDHRFCVDIAWVLASALSEGYADDTYRPAATMTRQALAAFLHRAALRPPVDAPLTPTFPDVPAAHPFAGEIEWAAAVGLVEGFPDGTFRPTGTVTRQALAAFLHRWAGRPSVALPGDPTFADVPPAHPFAREIEWAAAAGLAEGFPDGTFRPAAPVTRQALAAYVRRAADLPPPAAAP